MVGIRVSALALVAMLSACGGGPPATPSPSSPSPGTSTPTVSPTPTPSPSPTGSPSPSPEPVAGEVPDGFGPDVEPAELPPSELVPQGADVTGQWFAFTDDGVVVLVAWAEPGPDPFHLARGLVMWGRHPAAPHWRPAFVERNRAGAGIQEIQVSSTDLTGDGSDDALVFQGIGGSGACGSWLVIDLLRFREIYREELCDGRIEPGPPDAPGLVLTESVYRQGDAHCCPSAIRETTLAWTGRAWHVTGKEVVETT